MKRFNSSITAPPARRAWRRLLALGILLSAVVMVSQAFAQAKSVVLTDHEGSFDLAPSIEYLLTDADIDFEEAASAERQHEWQVNTKTTLNLGSVPHGAWIRFKLRKESRVDETWLLIFNWPMLDRVDLKIQYEDTNTWSEVLTAGDTVPLSSWPVRSRELVFPLALENTTDVTVYAHVRASEHMILPLQLMTEKALQQDQTRDTLLLGSLYGSLLVMLLYNASLFIFTRDKSYLWYVTYLASSLWYVLGLSGHGFLYLWGEWPLISGRFYQLSACTTFLTSALFIRNFLKVHLYPRLIIITNLVITYWVMATVVALFFPDHIRYLFPDILGFVSCLLALSVTVSIWRKNNPSAKYFTIAWLWLILTTIYMTLCLEGVFPLSTFSYYVQFSGFAFEFLLLSIALAERINRERAQRLISQKVALEASEEVAQKRLEIVHVQEELLDMQRRANEDLELRVFQRTQELEMANRKLVHLSNTDSLTQLYNRRYFDEIFVQEAITAAAQGIYLTVMMIDIDHFKRINDTYGHTVGDECIAALGEGLKGLTRRQGEYAARFGGEEFILLYTTLTPCTATAMAENVRLMASSLQVTVKGHSLGFTVSIGVICRLVRSEETRVSFSKAADDALYRAKQAGRNQVAVVNTEEKS
ncbi:deoxynucleoside kinase [Pseudomonas asuensis]|uniref:diguanylate cyclase n=1 Tax=Pseudomonas asuensis TaxID=1825787 RepID=A0ABQ2GZ75_9PSED|nr:diguanylate cyclase [Pseudomonas asuensis]GGM19520.1 deoxynucleoside kinase [Pseudomonas asuensis]